MRASTHQAKLTSASSSGHVAQQFRISLVWCPRNTYTFAAMDFGRRLGASDEHIPQWICKERATTPPPKRHAVLWVALKLAWASLLRRSSIAGDTLPPSRVAQANLSATNV